MLDKLVEVSHQDSTTVYHVESFVGFWKKQKHSLAQGTIE